MPPRRSSRRRGARRGGGGAGGGGERGLAECLEGCGVDAGALAGHADLDDQFLAIKRAYHKRVLEVHPDKGGDAVQFRDCRAAFETLRELFETKAIDSFVVTADATYSAAAADMFRKSDRYDPTFTPSWEFYEEAAQERMPLYKVELALSDRSKCNCGKKYGKCPPGSKIPKGVPRIGILDAQAGSYGRWVVLKCWRVPERIWRGVPDPDTCQDNGKFEAAIRSMGEIYLKGFAMLNKKDRDALVTHVMDPSNWANERKRKKGQLPETGGEKGQPKAGKATAAKRQPKVAKVEEKSAPAPKRKRGEQTGGIQPAAAAGKGSKKKKVPKAKSEAVSTAGGAVKVEAKVEAPGALVVRKVPAASGGAFVVPTPGVGLAVANSLKGETVVMTGIFPELGGGAGLSLGKDRAKAMISGFGGRVTSSVSGKTTLLLVGKEPGASKVSAAESKGVRMIGLEHLVDGLKVGRLPSPEKSQVQITEFSAGYYGNGWGGRRLENLQKRLEHSHRVK